MFNCTSQTKWFQKEKEKDAQLRSFKTTCFLFILPKIINKFETANNKPAITVSFLDGVTTLWKIVCKIWENKWIQMVLIHLTTNFVHHPGIMHCRLNTNPDVLFEKEHTYFYKINLINMWKLSLLPAPAPPHPTLQFLGFVLMFSDNYMTEERETCSKLHLHASKLFSSPGSSNPVFTAKSAN